MALGALHETFAEQAARAQGDLRLDDVIAGAERIAFRVEVGLDALLLIIMHEAPGHWPRPAPQRQHHDEHPDAHAGQEEDGAAGQNQHHRRAHVGLLQHQGRRHQHQQQGDDQQQRAADVLRVHAVEITGQRERERDLHDLGRLQLDEAEVDPALRAQAGRAMQLDRNQQDERDAIERYDQRIQARMSITATPSITARPTPKRNIWRTAQGSTLPLAAE